MVVLVVAAAALAAGALAAGGGPQRHLNAADERWARSIPLRRADLRGAGWQARRPRATLAGSACRRTKESDLVLTGEARDAELVRSGAIVASQATVFATAADAGAAWQRGLRRPIFRCLAGTLQRMFSAPGARVVVRGTARLRSGGVALLIAGYRVRFDVRGPQGTYRARLGYYRLTRGRADAILLVMSFIRPVEPVRVAEERRLLDLLAARMRK